MTAHTAGDILVASYCNGTRHLNSAKNRDFDHTNLRIIFNNVGLARPGRFLWHVRCSTSSERNGRKKKGGKHAQSQTSLTSDGHFLQLGRRALGLFIRHEFYRVVVGLVVANRDHQREWLGHGFGHPFRNNNRLGQQLRHFDEERYELGEHQERQLQFRQQ
jgi:hypothetical protein